MNSDRVPTALVIGAGSAIAKALIAGLLHNPAEQEIIAVSRGQQEPLANVDSRIRFIQCDYSEAGINETAHQLAGYSGRITRVFICTGVLHNEILKPEKRVEDIQADQLSALFRINSILPALWLQALLPVIKNSQQCVFTIFSARVGSISDNRTGGWYSYRASKAALNMLIKTAAIEYARRAPGVKLLAFHPGTVDTELSRPFQKNVPAEKLFTPAFVAAKLIEITDGLRPDGEASYLDWAGQAIQW
ncbi:MAG: SDR family NAD(P)-dependent oxidoreductase [Pseudohongiella sp.]|nr:SDR family NAD(P)-dependent oxidoreductase [Pseudohongiella sp.]